MKEGKSRDSSRLDMRKSVEVQVDSDFALLLPSGAYEIKKMEPRRRLRSIVFICLMLAVAGIIGFGYFCPDQVSFLKFYFRSSKIDPEKKNASLPRYAPSVNEKRSPHPN